MIKTITSKRGYLSFESDMTGSSGEKRKLFIGWPMIHNINFYNIELMNCIMSNRSN